MDNTVAQKRGAPFRQNGRTICDDTLRECIFCHALSAIDHRILSIDESEWLKLTPTLKNPAQKPRESEKWRCPSCSNVSVVFILSSHGP